MRGSVKYASASEPHFSTTIGGTPALIVKNRGFSLIEIGVVIVITGSLLGTVIKGQELITSSRVRNVAAQLEGVKIAYLGFQDRTVRCPATTPVHWQQQTCRVRLDHRHWAAQI